MTSLDARRVLDAAVSEKDLERVVVEAAERFGWWRYHTHDSRRSPAGWPDEVLVRGTEMILAELKTETGRVSPVQQDVLARLRRVEGVEVHVWRPSDIDQIIERLGRTPA